MQLVMNIEPGLLERAVISICPDVWTIIKKKKSRRRMSEETLWEELVCCILSSQVPYENARATTKSLKKYGLLTSDPINNFEQQVRDVLHAPITVCGRSIHYRFPNIRANQIARARKEIFRTRKALSHLVYDSESAEALREQLAREIPGMGLKQASMFLRNVGVSYDLAILDTHVFKYMYALNIVDPYSDHVARGPNYLGTELRLRRYADIIGYPVGCLDWAIWVVMRVATREGYA